MAGTYRLVWVIRFTMAEELWFHDDRYTDPLVELVAKTAWWPKLEVLGSDNSDTGPQPLGPLGQRVDEVQRRIVGGRGRFTLAQGSPRAATYTDESEAFLQIDQAPGYLSLALGASGAALADLKEHALDDVIELVLALRRAWPGKIQLTHASAAPGGDFSYNRMDPPRAAVRPLHAIADLFDPAADDEERALAEAAPPAGAKRQEREGLTILRLVDDPSQLAKVQAAAASHERWMADVIKAPVDD